jgi:hypothetical protein
MESPRVLQKTGLSSTAWSRDLCRLQGLHHGATEFAPRILPVDCEGGPIYCLYRSSENLMLTRETYYAASVPASI